MIRCYLKIFFWFRENQTDNASSDSPPPTSNAIAKSIDPINDTPPCILKSYSS